MTAKTAPPAAPVTLSADGPPAPDAAKELAREAGDIARRTTEQIARVVVGAEAVTEQLLTAMLAGGHVLLEGVPGVLGAVCLPRLTPPAYAGATHCPVLAPQGKSPTMPSSRPAGADRARGYMLH